MKLKTHKSELKLNKTEKSEVKTTARKQFVKNTIKDGIKKTDDPMEKEMVQGLMVAGYVTSKGAKNWSQGGQTRKKDISYRTKNLTVD